MALLAFCLRVWRLDYQSLWRDEVDAVIFATRPLAEALAMFTRVGDNGPLYFLGLHGWINLAGSSEFAIRFPSAVFGVLAVLLTFQLGRMLISRQIGLIGALLMAVSPYHIWYSQEAKMYALISFLAPFSLLMLLHALRGGRRWLWPLWAALMAAFLYVHLFAAMMLLVAFVWLAVLTPLHRPRLSPALALAALAIIAAGLPVARWLIPVALTPAETGYVRFSLGEMIAILLRNFSMGLRPASGPWPVALFTILLVVGCAPLIVRPRGDAAGATWPPARGVALMLLYVITPLLAIWLVSLRRPTFTDRYLIIVLPAFFLLIASGIVVAARVAAASAAGTRRVQRDAAPSPQAREQTSAVASIPAEGTCEGTRQRRVSAARPGTRYESGDLPPSLPVWEEMASPPLLQQKATGVGVWQSRLAALLLAIVVLTLAPFVWAQSHNTYKADFRAATAYVTSQAQPQDLVLFVMPYVQRGFSYYHPQPVRTAEPPYTRDMSAAQVDTAMRSLAAGSTRVWLYLSEADFWDERGLIAAWLERNAVRRCGQEFAYIEVRCYDLPQ